MKNINVVDLDNTLIPFDSIRFYLIQQIKKGNLYLLLIALLRKFRFLSRYHFSKILFYSYENRTVTFKKNFINILYNSIDKDVLTKIADQTNKEDIFILCSASPEFYVKPLAEKIGYIGFGSFLDSNKKYIHLFRKNKIELIINLFPRDQYNYEFAISDSINDIDLLILFNKYLLLK